MSGSITPGKKFISFSEHLPPPSPFSITEFKYPKMKSSILLSPSFSANRNSPYTQSPHPPIEGIVEEEVQILDAISSRLIENMNVSDDLNAVLAETAGQKASVLNDIPFRESHTVLVPVAPAPPLLVTEDESAPDELSIEGKFGAEFGGNGSLEMFSMLSPSLFGQSVHFSRNPRKVPVSLEDASVPYLISPTFENCVETETILQDRRPETPEILLAPPTRLRKPKRERKVRKLLQKVTPSIKSPEIVIPAVKKEIRCAKCNFMHLPKEELCWTLNPKMELCFHALNFFV